MTQTRLSARRRGMTLPLRREMSVAVENTLHLRKSMARLIAEEQRELAELATRTRLRLPTEAKPKDIEMAMRSLTAELAVLHHVSDRTMSARISDAETLVNQFPSTLEYLELGRIQMGHVRTIVEQGLTIEDADVRACYELEVLERAASVTPGRLRRFAQLTAVRLAKISFDDRHRLARDERHMTVTNLDDGMSELAVTMPTVLAEGVWDRLTQQAQSIHVGNDRCAKDCAKGCAGYDSRTFDQIRADLAAELLLTGQPSAEPDAPHAAGVGFVHRCPSSSPR